MEINIELVQTIDKSYKIYIEKLSKIKLDTKVAIITNPKVSGLHLKYLLDSLEAKEIYIITVSDGEQYKNIESVDQILESLFNHKFNRSSKIIAFGGGVIGDMSGFVASIYQRGIDFIQIPTTLLSQVDASVGGKTGINNKFGKNLIGAFHQPKAVYIDTHFLSTLPRREFGAGVAEIVKMAVTFDKDFFNFLYSNDLYDLDIIKEVIALSAQTKANVVSQDEKEKGIRAALNYGHTFGHVIEKETLYKKYLHGEAVAIGMVMANKLACRLNMMSEDEALKIESLLKKYNLPTTYEIKDVESFYEAFFLDKKSLDTTLTFILPSNIGGVEILKDVKKDDLIEVLKCFIS